VVALDAKTGKRIWTAYTIAQTPKPYRKNAAGTDLMGPAGAAIWSAPTIDTAKNRIYVATGNSYTDVDTKSADSVMAIDLTDGKVLWSNQVTPNDNWILGCVPPNTNYCPSGNCTEAGKGNCPVTTGPDHDFGASPILRTLPNGKRILIAGQKSAWVYGLDPDEDGKLLWKVKAGAGGSVGGIEWGMAADDAKVYAPASDLFVENHAPGGLSAIDFATGKTIWHADPNPVCAWGEDNCNGAQSQAVTAIPGIVFSGALDGHLRAYRASDGKIIWDFDTGRSFAAVNQAKAQGGSLNQGGPTLAGGMLYVNSGYGRFDGRNGNVLLAFSVDGK